MRINIFNAYLPILFNKQKKRTISSAFFSLNYAGSIPSAWSIFISNGSIIPPQRLYMPLESVVSSVNSSLTLKIPYLASKYQTAHTKKQTTTPITRYSTNAIMPSTVLVNAWTTVTFDSATITQWFGDGYCTFFLMTDNCTLYFDNVCGCTVR